MAAVSVRKKKSFAQSSEPVIKMCMLDHKELMTMSSPELMWPIPMRAIGAQNLLTMPGGVSIAGYLHKKGGSQFSLLKWPLRYIILHKGCVYYFKTSTSAAPQGAFSLNGYNRVMRAAEETTSSNVFPFKIVHFSKKHRTWLFSAASEEERRSWMKHLRREIDHYNDRQESHTPSDTDSDSDSFYGTIERVLDIKHPIDNMDDDYMEEDEDEDEEDYLKPDSSPTNTSQPTGPPPSYPPPPVPLTALSNQLPPDCKAPPIPPHLHRSPTSPLPKKPLPVPRLPTFKGPPPDPPFAPHLQRHAPFPPMTPPLPPPNPRRTVSRAAQGDRSLSAAQQTPTTLLISAELESRLRLNRPTLSPTCSPIHSPSNSQAHSPTPYPAHKQACSLTHSSVQTPAHSSAHGPSLGNHLCKPKPPPPAIKPPVPTFRKPSSTSSLGRVSPEGQSFRASTDEVQVDFRTRWDSTKPNGDKSDEDEDYENVQLPNSVFINSTETSYVEKLFRESSVCPNGLYAIRNSGTKTSKVLVVWDISINKARNYRLFEENGCIFLETELTFPSLAILIEHYHSHPLPQHGSLCLQKPFGP